MIKLLMPRIVLVASAILVLDAVAGAVLCSPWRMARGLTGFVFSLIVLVSIRRERLGKRSVR